jgi:hypothetical protein
MTHKTWKNVKSSLLTLNKVCTKVNEPQSETNYPTLDKLSYNQKTSIVETPGRSTFIIKKHLHHRYEEGGYIVFLKRFVTC